MDCEMVGVGEGGVESVLARVSIVNFHGHLVLDRFVRSREKVTDHRTAVSGIRPEDIRGPGAFFFFFFFFSATFSDSLLLSLLLLGAKSFEEVQKECAAVFKDRIVVGHALVNDFQALLLPHPRRLIRDTSAYPPFKKVANGMTPSMRMLAKKFLGMQIQKGEHSSVRFPFVFVLLKR